MTGVDVVGGSRTYNVGAHPGASSPHVSDRMSKAARRDTAAELAVRRELHRRGLRFRVQVKVPGRPRRTIDIAFTRFKLAVFIDGCFWHGCPEHATQPASNAAWWQEKLASNMARDVDTGAHLSAAGWSVVRIWEHEQAVDAADRVAERLMELRAR